MNVSQRSSGHEDASGMVQAVISDFQTLIEELKEGMSTAEESGDETTGDMVLSIYQSLEKHVWKLSSFLEKQKKSYHGGIRQELGQTSS